MSAQSNAAKRRSHYFTSAQEDWLHSKKKTYGYRERDEAKRQAFVAQLSTLLPSQIVYVDESEMDNRDEYGYGWNKQGERFHALKSERREGRVNMIAAVCDQNLSAPFTVEGACNRTVFETWVETWRASNTCSWTGCGDG